MEVINVYQAKSQLSSLLAQVQSGKSFILGKAGKPIAHLTPHLPNKMKKRKFGSLKGKIWLSPDFEQSDKAIEKLLYDSEIFPSR